MNSVTTVRLLVAVVTKQLALLKLSLQGLPAHIAERFADLVSDSGAFAVVEFQSYGASAYATLAT
jgi:hypothetical protein